MKSCDLGIQFSLFVYADRLLHHPFYIPQGSGMQVHRSSHSMGRIQAIREPGGGISSPGALKPTLGSSSGPSAAATVAHKALRSEGRGSVSKSLTFASKQDHDSKVADSDAQNAMQQYPSRGIGQTARAIGTRLEALVARPMFGINSAVHGGDSADVGAGSAVGRLHAMRQASKAAPSRADKKPSSGGGPAQFQVVAAHRASTGCILPEPTVSMSPGGGAGRLSAAAAADGTTASGASKGRPQLPSILVSNSSVKKQVAIPAPPPLLPRFHRASEPQHLTDDARTSDASSISGSSIEDAGGPLMVTAHIGVHQKGGEVKLVQPIMSSIS